MQRSIIKKSIGMMLIITIVTVLSGCSILGGFDAPEYVKAILDQHLKGDIKEASKLIEDSSKADLKNQYEDVITDFVQNAFTSQFLVDEALEKQYVALCKKIFSDLKYEVKDAKRISATEYEVNVAFQSVDIFQTFEQAIMDDSRRLVAKASNGEYKGTKDEITNQMLAELGKDSYIALKASYENATLGEKEIYTFKVISKDKKVFEVSEDEMAGFIMKILRLDGIQD